VDPRASLDAVAKVKIHSTRLDSNPNRPYRSARNLVANVDLLFSKPVAHFCDA